MTEMNTEETFTLAFNIERMQPGCILLQAALGATIPEGLFYAHFDPEDWITDKIEGLKLYNTTRAELVQVANRVRELRWDEERK